MPPDVIETPIPPSGAASPSPSEAKEPTRPTPESANAGADPWAGLDAALRPLVESKAWKTGSDAVRGYAAAEKMLGKPADELVHVPKAGLTPEMKRELKARILGTPEKPDAYDFGDMKDDAGAPPMLEWFRGVAHKLGFGQEEARQAAEAYREFGAAQQASQVESVMANRQKAEASLQAKYGTTYPAMREAGARALAALGITDASSNEASEIEVYLEQAMGEEKFFETFANLGQKLGESRIVESDTAKGGSIASLKAEHANLMASEAMLSKAHPGHQAAADRALEIMSRKSVV